jgi:hypothetical protein
VMTAAQKTDNASVTAYLNATQPYKPN